MSSPAKRPAVTYNRRSTSKISTAESANFQASSLLNPDAALQEKINSVLFSDDNNDNTSKRGKVVIEEEEFDSAYHETIVRKDVLV